MKLMLDKLFSGLFKMIHWPICRAYARHLGDRPADAILRWLCRFQFWKVHLFWPDFLHPKSFTEKLWSRMLHERDPQFTLISDKLRVRDFADSKVGGEYLVPLLWHGDDPNEIPFDELPFKFVIKTNHGCDYNIIVKDKTKLDQTEVRRQLRKWLGENFCKDTFLGIAWGYKNIKPTIMVESFLDDNGRVPVDYKFYCFSGRVEILTLHFDRFEEHKAKAFDRNFEPHQFRPGFKQYNGTCERPPNFEAMVQLAESLADAFDFIRVDLYSLENKIYFGELTLYPGGVSSLRGFDVTALDYVLGEKWGRKR